MKKMSRLTLFIRFVYLEIAQQAEIRPQSSKDPWLISLQLTDSIPNSGHWASS